MDIVQVLLPLPLSRPYDYESSIDLRPGDFVQVPFGTRHVIGIVWSIQSETKIAKPLKQVIEKVSPFPLPDVSRQFIEWVARYTMAPLGSVLRMAMSVPDVFKPEIRPRGYIAAPPIVPSLIHPKRRRVLEIAGDGEIRTQQDLAKEAGVTRALITKMIQEGLLIQKEMVTEKENATFIETDRRGPVLSPEQQKAARFLLDQFDAHPVTLLDGVTGSGKTEVYFEAIAECLKRGKQALVLLPEITLTAQWLQRFEARFGMPPGQWHSDLTPKIRKKTWRAVLEGSQKVIVGARSALFLPFADLGLIVVDEEHDSSFKQEEGVIYQARDMAVLRAHMGKIPIILSSATPSLESLQNVEAGKYERLQLQSRHGGAHLPEISLIDLRKDRPKPGFFISDPLVAAMRETLSRQEQILLFLNRRGYAPLTLCRSCGERLQCPHCSAWLVEHRTRLKLQCHHCGFETRLPPACPKCGVEKDFAACGPGVERIAEEAQLLFPQSRLFALSSDITSSPAKAQEMIARIERREVDIIIGTQIIAKGHHFPFLTLVGIVDADLGLSGGDLRGSERCFQLLQQVAGRAGRADRAGRVFVQTFDPTRSVMQALQKGDRGSFIEAEINEREAAGMPPFGRLAALILSGRNEGEVEKVARQLAQSAPRPEGARILGPAPAPLSMLRGRHRRRFLLKCRKDFLPQNLLRDWLKTVRLKGDIDLQIDIDPYSFL